MNIEKLKHIHFTGIKGVGMAGLAICCLDLGIKVTGSDVEESFVTDETLKRRGISWDIGFNVQDFKTNKPDLLITTAAHGGLDNPEVVRAKTEGIPVVTYAEGLALFAKSKRLLSVCGVGGKSTISSMLSVLFEHTKQKPSFVVGVADIFPISTPARYRKDSKYFICEADEYAISPGINDDPKFSLLNPYVTVVTNIEHDHPDIYPTFTDTRRVFKKYFDRIPKEGLLVACVDNTNVERMVPDLKVPVATYGLNKNADYIIKNINYGNQKTKFVIKGKDKEVEVENSYASAREKVDKTIDSKVLVKKVEMQGKKAIYTGSKEKTLEWIKNNTKPGDVVVTVGAGDIFQLHQLIS